jgi:hypothetical protein
MSKPSSLLSRPKPMTQRAEHATLPQLCHKPLERGPAYNQLRYRRLLRGGVDVVKVHLTDVEAQAAHRAWTALALIHQGSACPNPGLVVTDVGVRFPQVLQSHEGSQTMAEDTDDIAFGDLVDDRLNGPTVVEHMTDGEPLVGARSMVKVHGHRRAHFPAIGAGNAFGGIDEGPEFGELLLGKGLVQPPCFGGVVTNPDAMGCSSFGFSRSVPGRYAALARIPGTSGVDVELGHEFGHTTYGASLHVPKIGWHHA